MLQVDADLMGAARAGHAGDQAVSFVDGEDFIIGHRLAPRGGAAWGHFLAIDGMAANGEIDGSLHMAGSAPNDCQIGFLDLAVGKLLREGRMSLVVLGNHNAAAGFLVQTVDDAGSVLFRSGGKRAPIMQQGIDEGSLFVARADVNDHSGWFVDDQEIGVLMEDFKWNIFRTGPGGRFRWFFFNHEEIPALHFVAAANGFSLEGDAPCLDEGLDLGTREVGKMANQHHVEPLAAILFGGCDFVDGGFGHGSGFIA